MLFRNKFLILTTNLYFFSVGLSWVVLYIYLRFFTERNPYNLMDIKSNISGRAMFIVFILIIIHTLFVLVYIYKLYRNKQKTNNILHYSLVTFINFIYWKPLKFLHDLIIPKIPKSGEFLFKFGAFLHKTQPKNKTFFTFVIIFSYIPRLIVITCLFIDVYVYKTIYYFFLSLGLLLIPIIFQIFSKILSDFCKRNLLRINQVIEIKPNPEKGLQWYSYSIKPEYSFIDNEEFYSWIEAFEVISNLENFTQAFNNIKDKYLSLILLVCSLGYIICWTRYLWFMLYDSPNNCLTLKIFIFEHFYFFSILSSSYIEEPFSGFFI